MDSNLVTVIASVVAAMLGGLTGFASSYFTTRLSLAHEEDMLVDQAVRERMALLLPLRQQSLQKVWSTLLAASLGDKITAADRNEYLGLTLWLPTSLRVRCIEAMSRLDDRPYIVDVQKQVVAYIEQLEGREAK